MESISEKRFIPVTSVDSGEGEAVAATVSYLPVQIVNVVFIGVLGEGNEWVLVDAGMPLGERVHALPIDGSVPALPEWKWIHTSGHSPGHISLFRENDRTLIDGDAFVTVNQESLYKVVTQKEEISGPPRYLTTDWEAARTSVEKLHALRPDTAITGHGRPMSGDELKKSLDFFVKEFDTIAVPEHGRFVDDHEK